MPRFGGFELERRIDLKRFRELVSALGCPTRGAIDESKIFVRLHLVGLAETGQGNSQDFGSFPILAVLVSLDAGEELRCAFAA
jgi:hypothetical protein